MKIKVFDSELKIMEALWKEGDLTAGQLVKILKQHTGWNPNTTYTVIGKLIDKGAVERYGTNFSCRALITKEQVQQYEATELIGKLFDGSAEIFLSAFLSGKELSNGEIEHLKQLVEKLK
jgi:predicted transcriptional regulator